MGKKRKRAKAKAKANKVSVSAPDWAHGLDIIEEDSMEGVYGYGYGTYGGGAKKVATLGDLEVWAGPFSEAPKVSPDLYLSLNGSALRPLVEDKGLGLDFPLPTPRGLSINWPDFGVPGLPRAFWEALASRLASEKGRLYIGCSAGHGRTGTALAILAYFWGLTNTPIAWVREAYSRLAVETDEQARYVGLITGVQEDLGGALEVRQASVFPISGSTLGAGTRGAYAVWRSSAETDYKTIVERVIEVVAEEEGVSSLSLEVEEDSEGFYIRGSLGDLEVVPPSGPGGQWAVSLWDGSGAKTERSELPSRNSLLRKFLVWEDAILRLAEATGFDLEYFDGLSYSDIWGLTLSDDGKFIAPDGQEMTPEEAACYLLGGE